MKTFNLLIIMLFLICVQSNAQGKFLLLSPKANAAVELVADGTFDVGFTAGWVDGYWVIANGVATNDGVNSYAELYQEVGVETGKSYRVKIDVVVNSGAIVIALQNDAGAVINASGSYEQTFTNVADSPAQTGRFRVITWANFDGSVDNASVKEIQ